MVIMHCLAITVNSGSGNTCHPHHTLSSDVSWFRLMMKWQFEDMISKQMDAIKKVCVLVRVTMIVVVLLLLLLLCTCSCVSYGKQRGNSLSPFLLLHPSLPPFPPSSPSQGFDDVFPLRMLRMFDETELEVQYEPN